MRYGHNNIVWRQIARDKAWTKQDKRCMSCLIKLKRGEVTAEHIVPRSRGGTDTNDIGAACGFCNLAKGSIPPKKFKSMINGSAPCESLEIEVVRVCRALNRQTMTAVKRIHNLTGVRP